MEIYSMERSFTLSLLNSSERLGVRSVSVVCNVQCARWGTRVWLEVWVSGKVFALVHMGMPVPEVRPSYL